MKLNFFLVFLSLFLSCRIFGQQWERSEDFPGVERDDGICFVINDRAYCGTGLPPWWSPLGDFYAFEPESENWTSISPMPSGKERQYACGFSHGSAGYVFGGTSGSGYLNDFWQLNPDNQEWKEMPSLPGAGRSGAVCFILGDAAYIVGGKINDSTLTKEVWAFDFNLKTWERKGDIPFASRFRASGAGVLGKGYLMFGKNELENFPTDVWTYNDETDQWHLQGNLPFSGRFYAHLTSFDFNLLTFGGIDSNNQYLNDCWVFDPYNQTWEKLYDLPGEGRKGGMGFVLKNSFYYSTGIEYGGIRLKETWKYNEPIATPDFPEPEQFFIYPNPSGDFLYLKPHLFSKEEPYLYEIFDLQGRKLEFPLFDVTKPIADIRRLAKGIYIIKIHFWNNQIIKKFIKV